MRKRSFRSAGIVWLDREERLAAVRACARRLAEAIPAVRRILLFGSLAKGAAGPRSDADLLVVVSSSPHAHLHERALEVSRQLGPLPCAVDVFVFTEDELERTKGFGVARVATAEGIDLLEG